MLKVMVGLALLGSLLVPSAAQAGGWATAGLTPSQPPKGSEPGDRWVALVEVLQHGQTPLNGVEPVLTLTNAESGKEIEFPAKPTGEDGLYRVVATLPARGTWNVSVYDGFDEYGGGQAHTFGSFAIGEPTTASTSKPQAPAPAASPAGFPTVPVVGGVLAAFAAAAVFVLARRSRKRAHVIA